MAIDRLTKKERELYAMVINEALTYKEIARRIHRSNATVRFHLGNIYAKLGVKNQSQLIVNHYKSPA